MNRKMPETDETRGMGFLLSDVARLFRREFDKNATETGLTRAQYQTLAHIKRQEGLSQTELASLLEVRPITLTRTLDRLAAKGWIERRSHKTDRRVRLLYLTRQAQPHTRALRAIARTVRQKAFAGINAADLQRMRDLLELVKQNLAREAE